RTLHAARGHPWCPRRQQRTAQRRPVAGGRAVQIRSTAPPYRRRLMVWIRAVRPTLLALLALCACIERPWQDPPQKREVDRGALSDVLLTSVPPGLTPLGAVFGGSAELVGYRLEPAALVPGQRTRLTLVWRCR